MSTKCLSLERKSISMDDNVKYQSYNCRPRGIIVVLAVATLAVIVLRM
jgi:hypothetical protein